MLISVASTRELTPQVLVDLAADGSLVGIEMLSLAARLPVDLLEAEYGLPRGFFFPVDALRPASGFLAVTHSAAAGISAPSARRELVKCV